MRKLSSIGMVACALMAHAVAAQDNAQGGAKDSGITREQADGILSELKQIRLLLLRQQQTAPAAPAQPTSGKLKIDGGYWLGSKDAPVTMVEFTDYECPFCRRFETTTLGEIRKKYVDTGKLRLVIRNMPLPIHPHALRAAQAALCAGDQGQFWSMRDLLFANPEGLAGDGILQSAQKLPMDASAFKLCLDGGKHTPDILKDMQEAASLQLNGTPAFLVGRTTSDGVEGSILMGALPFSAFEAKLREVGVGE